MRTDDLCAEHADRGVQLTVRELDGDTILIEGEVEALTFLAELLKAACEPGEDGVQIGPLGAGSALFTTASSRGLYLHCLPNPEGAPTAGV